ncbi:MAG: hypothetical protein U0T83_03700 [Bacteriovoracaceae bacterium]
MVGEKLLIVLLLMYASILKASDEKDLTSKLFLYSKKSSVSKENYHKFLKQMKEFRGFYQEGENLKNYCSLNKANLTYISKWQEEQNLRSVLATFQYHIIELMENSLVELARTLEFSENEFSNLTENITNNYCSPNITIKSIKLIKKEFLNKFATKDQTLIELPNSDENPFFVFKRSSEVTNKKERENQLIESVKIFKAACSWDGNVDNMRLLVPFVKNPYIAAYIIRQLANLKIEWDEKNSEVTLVKDKFTPRVSCDGFICRKSSREDFNRNFFSAVGSAGLESDLKLLYCKHFKDADYKDIKDPESTSEVKKWIKSQTFDEDYLQVNQLISVITKVSNLFLKYDKFTDINSDIDSSIDFYMNYWSKTVVSNFSNDLLWEEPISVVKVPREYYFVNSKPEFKVIFDVNRGEFDENLFFFDKVTIKMGIELRKDILNWIRKEWFNLSNSQKYAEDEKKLRDTLAHHIKDQVDKFSKKLIIIPWQGDISNLIAKELMEQITSYKGPFFRQSDGNQLVLIPIFFFIMAICIATD